MLTSAVRAPSALPQCSYASSWQSRGIRSVRHGSIVSCPPARTHSRMHRGTQHHLPSWGTISNAFHQGGGLRSFTRSHYRLQDTRVRSVEVLKRVPCPKICVACHCGQVFRTSASQNAPSIARRLYAACPSSQSGSFQSIQLTREVAGLVRKARQSCFHRVPVSVDRHRRTITTSGSLCKGNCAVLREAPLCTLRLCRPKELDRVCSARSHVARNSAGDGGLADGVAASRATIEEAGVVSPLNLLDSFLEEAPLDHREQTSWHFTCRYIASLQMTTCMRCPSAITNSHFDVKLVFVALDQLLCCELLSFISFNIPTCCITGV